MRDPALPPLLTWLRLRLTDLYGGRLRALVLYGSHARGDARPDSDVDLAFVLEGLVDPAAELARTAPLCADAVLEFGRFPSLYPLSAADFAGGDRPLLRAVREEGVPA
jgi:uncharacterized protein